MITFLITLIFSFNSYSFVTNIENSYQVDKDGYVFRGREPKNQISELERIGITDVIIFKNEVKKEVTQEIEQLKQRGIRHHHIPFLWKEITNYKIACEQVVDALKLLNLSKKLNRKTYFHCTAGEDRTGLLAGIYRMLSTHESRENVFKEEMCARNYSDGNLNKPQNVTAIIKRDLTPLFIALAEKVESGEWDINQISKESCNRLNIRPTRLNCSKK